MRAATQAAKDKNHSKKAALPEDLKSFARELRHGQTDAERALWQVLRGRRMAGARFRRQHPLEPYVLDFYCHDLKLAIELDGGQHNAEQGRTHDERRSAFLASQGEGRADLMAVAREE
ncbi:endonuclease domain-containing protein [Uliginosibacterium sp. sgz301328]|uniref:endonuclease domain-containing protein n=1 Tax=Uliginosibacterium sp. sgz301328 TaxID=3243764 RepID=UPI00359EA133